MQAGETGQVITSAAEIYDKHFVPALFREWGSRVTDLAGVKPGDWVLDVACGTGTLARTACNRVGTGGAVTGLDVNEGSSPQLPILLP